MHQERCLCDELPAFELSTRLCLVMHCRETTKTTATGPLSLAALSNSEHHLVGVPGAPLDLSHLHRGGRRVCVLFPAEDARPLDAVFVQKDARPVTLAVPDGNWGQASRIVRRVPGLAEAERVTLPPGPPTRWGLRRETREGGLATYEAIARALGILESKRVEEHMLRFFDRMVSSTFATRGYDRREFPLLIEPRNVPVQDSGAPGTEP
jgi:DTW domain-containing protein YfiP